MDSFKRRKNAGTKIDKKIVGTWTIGNDAEKCFVFHKDGESEFPVPRGSGKDLGSFVTRATVTPNEIDCLMSGRTEWFLGIYEIDSEGETLKLQWGSPPRFGSFIHFLSCVVFLPSCNH